MTFKPKFLHYIAMFMTICGLYKIETDSFNKKFLLKLWRFILYLTLIFLITSSAIDLWMKGRDDFELTVKNYIYLGGGVCALCRFTYFLLHEEVSSEIVKDINDVFKYKTDTGLVEKDLQKHVESIHKFPLMCIGYGNLALECFTLVPLIFSERSLSLPLWLPFDWRISPWYEVVVLLQIFIQMVLATLMTTIDMFFAGCLILTSAQFQILGWEFKHVVYKTLLNNNVALNIILAFKSEHSEVKSSLCRSQSDLDEDESTFFRNVLSSAKFRSDLLKNLNDLIQFYQSLVKFCERFNEHFSPTYLMYFVACITRMVFIEYNVVAVHSGMVIFLSSLFLIGGSITMLIPCYLGNFITSKAEEFVFDLYDTPWFICDRNFKTNFKMLHQMACRPLQFTIGKFGYLTLNSFLWLVRATISYLAVLRQVTSDA